jgi:hypothetical protein
MAEDEGIQPSHLKKMASVFQTGTLALCQSSILFSFLLIHIDSSSSELFLQDREHRDVQFHY